MTTPDGAAARDLVSVASVVVLVRRAEETVEPDLGSLLLKTEPNWEAVVDAGSDDGTANAVPAVQDGGSRMPLVREGDRRVRAVRNASSYHRRRRSGVDPSSGGYPCCGWASMRWRATTVPETRGRPELRARLLGAGTPGGTATAKGRVDGR
jgi:hypothetical protein